MRICIIDGQGGGIGSYLVQRIKAKFGEEFEIFALGTNSMATYSMMKARANRGATGENAIVKTCPKCDIIIGSISIIAPNSMLGELTPKMAEAVSESDALKLLIPFTRERIEIVGVDREPLPHFVDRLIAKLETILRDKI